MKRFKKEVRGSISLFLSMIMLLLVILEGFLIDGSKVLAGKMVMSTAGDLAMNAGLTYYDDALRRVYGLFATSKTEAELTENLERYYRETLGEATGTTDGGSYTDNLIDFVQQSITAGWNNEEAGKLLDLSLTSFSAAGMSNAALANEEVIKNQILEYMKYRGPASLGYGMIEKLMAFKDLKKQQKVMEDKLTYEEDMDEVQKACEEAYDALIAYNALLDKLKPDHVEAESDSINKSVYETVISVFALNVVKRPKNQIVHKGIAFTDDWQKDLHIDGHDVAQVFGACRNFESLKGLYRGDGNGAAADSTFVSNVNAGDPGSHVIASMQAVKLTLGYLEDLNDYQRLYTAWLRWEDYYEEESERIQNEIDEAEEDEDTSGLEEELEELDEQDEAYGDIMDEVTEVLGAPGSHGVVTALDQAADAVSEDIDRNLMKNATDRLHAIYENAKALELAAQLATEKLEDIIHKMENLKKAGQNWENSINALSEGDIKTSMKADYDNKSKELDQSKIKDLETYLDNGKVYGQELKQAGEKARVVNYVLKDGYGNASYAGYLNNNWNQSQYASTTNPYTNTPFSGFLTSEWVQNANNTQALSDSSFTVFFLDAGGGQSGSGKWSKMNLQTYRDKWGQTNAREHDFYKYLERICPKTEGDTDGGEAKEQKNALLDLGKGASFEPERVTSNTMSDSSGGDGKKEFTKTESNANDKTVSANAKQNSRASANFLDNIGALLTKGRDKLYISEYATEMFSYYTVDLPEGSQGKQTLSGYDINEANNYLYKAEVEYILWGNPDPKVDVQNTLATIFGIRFLMNTLYAFTGDPEIRSTSLALATSIAGWTGFGVPLVQSVIIIAFALAESVLDLNSLKQGESVPIYKSAQTWTIKPSGLTKEAIGGFVNKTAEKLENELFEGINNLTKDTIGEFNKKLTGFSDKKIDDIISTASAAVLTPIQEQIIGLVNVVTPNPAAIESAIDQALNGVENSISSEPDSVLKTAKLSAVSIVRSSCKSAIVSAVQSVQNQNLSAGEITDKIQSAIDNVKETLKSRMKSTVSGAINSLTSELQNSIDAKSDKLQEEVSEKVDQYLMRIDCGISFAELPGTGESKKVQTSGANALTMDYSEYLWMFIAVTSMNDEQESKMLQRIGNLIEKNMTLETNPNKSDSENFTMKGAYTFIGVEATADLTTTFFAMPVPMGGGTTTFGSDKYSIHYRSVLGY